MTVLQFTVPGIAAPQGSKTRTRFGMREDNPRTKPWRATVTSYALDARNGHPPLTGPVLLDLIIELPRPKSHFRTGKHAGELKPNAPRFCTTKPDASKLARAIEDALVDAGLLRDDALVAQLHVAKVYANDAPRVSILVHDLDDELDARPYRGADPVTVGASA